MKEGRSRGLRKERVIGGGFDPEQVGNWWWRRRPSHEIHDDG